MVPETTRGVKGTKGTEEGRKAHGGARGSETVKGTVDKVKAM